MKFILLPLLLFFSVTGNTALLQRGTGAIYDTTTNLTWVLDPLAAVDAQREAGSPGGIGGTGLGQANITLTPAGTVSFGEQSVIGNLNTINYLGVTTWRRPTAFPLATSTTREQIIADLTGPNAQGEIASLFRNNDVSIFNNLKGLQFWASSVQLADPANGIFSNNGVFLYDVVTQSQLLVNRLAVQAVPWAVATGDVASVPIPHTLSLMLSSLFLLPITRVKRNS